MPSIFRWGLGIAVGWLFLTLADVLSATMQEPIATLFWVVMLSTGAWVGWRVAHRRES